MKKVIFVFALILAGCNEEPTRIPPRFRVPERTVTVTITIKEDDTRYDCIHRGGVWVIGDSTSRINDLVGCIEPEVKK